VSQSVDSSFTELSFSMKVSVRGRTLRAGSSRSRDEELDAVWGNISFNSDANCAASDLFGSRINVGRCTCSMSQAIVAVLHSR